MIADLNKLSHLTDLQLISEHKESILALDKPVAIELLRRAYAAELKISVYPALGEVTGFISFKIKLNEEETHASK